MHTPHLTQRRKVLKALGAAPLLPLGGMGMGVLLNCKN